MNRPALLILTRQNMPTLDRSEIRLGGGLGSSGAYVLADTADGKPLDVILMATGSEVSLNDPGGLTRQLTAEEGN
jgi:transketolase